MVSYAGVKAGHFVRKFNPARCWWRWASRGWSPGTMSIISDRRPASSRRPMATSSSSMGTARTSASWNTRRTESTSRPGARLATRRASSALRTASLWTSAVGCSCAIGRTRASRSSIRMASSWRAGTSSECPAALLSQ